MPDLSSILGLDQSSLTWWQMMLRASIVYVAAIAMVRLGEKRFLGKNTAFDVILGIVLGSVVSRAITGGSPFAPIIVAGFTLVALHWIFAFLSFRFDRFGTLVKGSSRTLVEDGEIRWDEMRSSHVSREDLLGALRRNGPVEGPERVREARLERNGEVSVFRMQSEPRVVTIDVREGIQTVRIELAS